MRFVTFEIYGGLGPERRAGALLGDAVVDLNIARRAVLARRGLEPSAAKSLAEASVPPDLLALIQLEDVGLEAARDAVDLVMDEGVEEVAGAPATYGLGEVRLRSPLMRPPSLRDYMADEGHLRSALKGKPIPDVWYEIPVYYKGNVNEIYGPEDVVPWPAYTDQLDYELELAAVVGRRGRNISADDAASHIFGYTLFNDWSARDIQFREMTVGLGPSLGKDFANSFGPCLVTPDEIDRDAALLEARIDGEVWSTGTVGGMRFSFEDIIASTSREQTLYPGDILGSGTVAHGCGFELDKWLTQGCTVELEAEGIGILRNRVGIKGAGATRSE